ncbi:L,D-transpeptidase family protein [Pontixanthobacter luteolus]|uniref:L,D-transpeptidase family protein n=1 Tax=Pontixanthobacter luteolus TaxID=295089 RepID=UPI002304946B|nr:L,D-transpeptidase family protein [Pontixanthobacter luteolus]
MEPMVKWIGGATAALVLLLGGTTLASGLVTGDNSQDAPALEEAIPAEETVQADEIAQKQGIATTAEPTVQQVAQDTDDTFVIKRILPISGPIKYGEWHWDDEGVPDGPLVMTVDLDARVLSVFRGGYEIGASAVLLGTDEHPTPLGTFPIRYKMRHNVSEKYNNAPMPYSMFLTTDGVAIHGSQVENGYASHGCIGTPDDFAAKVFAIAKKGDKVIITRGKRIGMGDSII